MLILDEKSAKLRLFVENFVDLYSFSIFQKRVIFGVAYV